MTSTDAEALQKRLQVNLENPDLLVSALTHRSFATEDKGPDPFGNERLEFLGDAVLELVISEYLYRRYPSASEGDLTQRKSQLVSRRTLARVGGELGLGECLRVGKGAEHSGESARLSVLAAAVEAVIAAVYLDQGLEATRLFVLRILESAIHDQDNGSLRRDYKSEFQELAQGLWKKTPRYTTLEEEGPDHSKLFTVEVRVGPRRLGKGQGPSKKEAEQQAACAAMKRVLEDMV